ncbi:MAG: 3-mercaptopyruvate sulfurtransferase [Hyphomicrobiales bacterium]
MSKFKNMVSADWLSAHIDAPEVKPVDGSWYLPQQKRDPLAEFQALHIPGAVFFDLDAISDTSSDLPHMMPDDKTFAGSMSKLGISNKHHVVVYDGIGLMSAARIWWMFKVFGHQQVSILNGGLPAWKANGGKVTAETTQIEPTVYQACLDGTRVASWKDVSTSVSDTNSQILDARSADRFAGQAPEPRAGLKGGHIKGSFNLPFQKLLGKDGKLNSVEDLRSVFENSGISLTKPVTTSCGSGVTAAILTLGLDELGHTDNQVYDGSWAEWGALSETKHLIET